MDDTLRCLGIEVLCGYLCWKEWGKRVGHRLGLKIVGSAGERVVYSINVLSFRSKLVTVPTLLVRNRVFALVFWRSGGQVWSLQHAYTNKTQAHCAKPLSPMFSSATLSLFALTAPPPSPSKTSTPKLNRAGTLFLIKPSPSSGASIHSIVPSPGGFTQPFTHHYHRCYGYCCYRSSYPQTKLES